MVHHYLVAARAGLEVEIRKIHLLETEWTIGVLLKHFSTSEMSITSLLDQKAPTASSSLQYASWTPARTCDLALDAMPLLEEGVTNDLDDDMRFLEKWLAV
jgi:hypothetical protein